MKRARLSGAVGLVLLTAASSWQPAGAVEKSASFASATSGVASAQAAAQRPPQLPNVPKGAQKTTVVRIIDGDTVVLRAIAPSAPLRSTAQVTVRLLEIDTPETKKPGTPVQCYGPQATARTKQLLPVASAAYVVRDMELRDQYGRYLLYVWNRSGRLVNEDLARGGYGRVVLYPPNDAMIKRMRAAERSAKMRGAGLWGRCVTETTDDYYANCDEARAAGAAPIQEGEPGYRRELDRDGDGIACE